MENNKKNKEDNQQEGKKSELDDIIKKHNKELRKIKEQLKEQEELSDLIEALKVATVAKDSKIEELSKLIDRERAEFKNYRKRTEDEKKTLVNEGKGLAAASMASVLDVVYNAINMITDIKIADGVTMIARKLESILLGLGVEEIQALNEHFDPELHNALMRVHVDDPSQDGVVVEVFQKGYRLGDKVLRHCQVKVGAKG